MQKFNWLVLLIDESFDNTQSIEEFACIISTQYDADLAEKCATHNIAFLTINNYHDGIDGIHLNDFQEGEIKKIRSLYNNIVIGVDTNNSYDNAMIAGIEDVDYVMFNDQIQNEVITNWIELTNIQIMIKLTDINRLDSLMNLQVDFIAIDYKLWQNTKEIFLQKRLNNEN
jgi:hypothetical protein